MCWITMGGTVSLPLSECAESRLAISVTRKRRRCE
jgi:hypothetical protein